mmetsp:Transcript_8189/g.15144  ORF Transcript_8189/g.15144 Transcript_8189/m.15144 type:complete len:82 (+) Transcript_8189:2612-2857(+)
MKASCVFTRCAIGCSAKVISAQLTKNIVVVVCHRHRVAESLGRSNSIALKEIRIQESYHRVSDSVILLCDLTCQRSPPLNE